MDLSFEQKRQQTAQRLGIEPSAIPRHIAIIMDGNGRWAANRGLPRFRGHEQGGKAVETIAQHGVNLGLEYMSLYSFSMQNWKRPQDEIDFLMYLYTTYLEAIRPSLMENEIKLVHLGRTERLPDEVVKALFDTVEITGANSGMTLGLALNYGARSEIADAARKIAKDCIAGKLSPEDIDTDCFSSYLYTAGMKDPDLVIRTSGELRISNFLLWQISYSEFYVTDTLWPDFDEAAMDEAIRAYAQRSRRFGDVKSQPTR